MKKIVFIIGIVLMTTSLSFALTKDDRGKMRGILSDIQSSLQQMSDWDDFVSRVEQFNGTIGIKYGAGTYEVNKVFDPTEQTNFDKTYNILKQELINKVNQLP